MAPSSGHGLGAYGATLGCTLFVFDAQFGFLTLETTVTILERTEVPDLSVPLFRQMQGTDAGSLSWFGADLDEDEFRQVMVQEQRLIYEFEVQRAYGLHG